MEALIAGWPLPEALKRADAYRKAGADAILMHRFCLPPTITESEMLIEHLTDERLIFTKNDGQHVQ